MALGHEWMMWSKTRTSRRVKGVRLFFKRRHIWWRCLFFPHFPCVLRHGEACKRGCCIHVLERPPCGHDTFSLSFTATSVLGAARGFLRSQNLLETTGYGSYNDPQIALAGFANHLWQKLYFPLFALRLVINYWDGRLRARVSYPEPSVELSRLKAPSCLDSKHLFAIVCANPYLRYSIEPGDGAYLAAPGYQIFNGRV
ncbi:hypothetical protein OG21DRAFT_1309051 [Imleria badia]|nr:hypothetical protein OG21DRAFT_1309051 [Imleria badia]